MIPALLLLAGLADADPCGMVPPMNVTTGPTVLMRDGVQRTYVMHDRGIQTIALRPGFKGSVDDFGMLIPFPSVPAIRKIDDNTFAHIEAAVDPPEMEIQILDPMILEMASAPRGSDGMRRDKSVNMVEAPIAYDSVVVVKEEAVGMYQVAVLEAGSPRALGLWMEDNGYKYPEGMDEVVADYVSQRWCFVAVKAKVGQGPGVAPGPGLREVNPDRPAGSTFDGFVQGMGFRFESEEPVVPMRLSVFNGADPRNVVYMLTGSPVKFQDMPENLVVRQVPGEELYGHLTQPIPQRFMGGKRSDVASQLPALEPQRDPGLYNGVARDLFASDLLAARTGRLSLDFEEAEKELLNISESLNLRGPAIDGLYGRELARDRAIAVDGALDDVKEMHLTVLDGVFPGHVLSSQNLGFQPYTMPANKNEERISSIRPLGPSVTLYR
jgi:hypothetical protein